MPETKPCRCGHCKTIHLPVVRQEKKIYPCARLECNCQDYDAVAVVSISLDHRQLTSLKNHLWNSGRQEFSIRKSCSFREFASMTNLQKHGEAGALFRNH